MSAKAASPAKRIKIQQYRSGICCPVTHKRVLKSLGLGRINRVVEMPDNAAIRGMVQTIPHLVRIVEQ